MQKEHNQPLLEEITSDNREHKIQNILFSKEYYEFVTNLLDDLDKVPQEKQVNVLKYIITVFLTVTVR
jgi:hypothetical protein